MTTESIDCPKCGAPLKISSEQKIAICLYCDSSVRLSEAPEEAGTTKRTIPTIHDIPKGVVERVKQMVADGKRFEAVQYYQEQVGLSQAEAEFAINSITLPLVWKLTRQVPLNTYGILMALAIIIIATLGLAWSLWQMLKGTEWYFLLAGLFGVLLYERIRWLVPKIVSTWVSNYGAEGRAKILKTAIIRPGLQKDGTLVILLMDVQPIDGQPSFRDEETILVRDQSLPKIQAGNTIRVRFDRRTRDRVFPFSPIQVVEWGSQDH